MHCWNCGKEINDKAYVCIHCGAKVHSDLSKGPVVIRYGRSKIVAGLLGIFLGGLGINNFYIGNVGLGIVDIVFSWTGLPALINFIRGIVYLCESDESFADRLD